VSASADSRGRRSAAARASADRVAAAVVSVARLDWFTPDMTPFAGRPFDVVRSPGGACNQPLSRRPLCLNVTPQI